MNEVASGFRGGCLCGAVRFESHVEPKMALHCYCVDCRKSSGTGHGTHVVVPEDAFAVSGEVTFYDRPADSGHVVSRGFCGACGSPLFSKNSGYPGMIFPRASVLDDPGVARPQLSVYASRAVSWDQTDPSLPAFDEMPPANEA